MPKNENRIIVGLDIGTSKIVALVAEINADNDVEIIGIGTSPSRGLKKGVVVNIEATVDSIQRAINEAEMMSDIQINTVFAGIAGSHISSMNSIGVVKVSDGEVSENDVARVIEAARAMNIPDNQRILHVLPKEFIIDMQEGIREPVGMSGVRLESACFKLFRFN